MKMKKVVYILIGLVLVGFGIGFLSWNLSGNKVGNILNTDSISWENNHKDSSNYKDIDEKSIEKIDGIDEINIKVNYAQVNIISQDREDIDMHYYGKLSPHIKTSLNTKISGDELIIKADTKNTSKFNLSNNANLYLDIIIPTSYKNDLNVETDLGSIKIKGLELNELKAESSLGAIYVEDVSSMKNKYSADLGAIKTKNIQGDLEAKTSLGSIELDYDDLNWDIDAESDSGSIKVILPKNSSFILDAKTDLGSIKSNFPLDNKESSNTKLKGISGNGKNNISLSVDLGSIDVKSK